MPKIDDLRWIRVFTPFHIPKYLVDQIKKRDYEVDDFYKYQEDICLRMTNEGPTLNPLSHLYVLANSDNHTKGFTWFTVDPLTKELVVQSYSVDKEYWKDGGAMDKLASLVKEIRRKANLKRIVWVTNYPKHSMKHGFKQSRSVVMEYEEEDENNSSGDKIEENN